MSQTANTLDRSYIRHHRIDLPVGKDVERNITGVYFMVAEQEGNGEKFQIAFDDDPFFPVILGLKFELPGGNFFSKLRLRNETDAEMTVELYTGTIMAEDMRLNIVRGRVAPMMKAETVITAHSTTIAAGGEVDLTGPHPAFPKYVRAATIVFNMDPAVDLDIANADDELVAPVLFRQGINLESSEGVKVQNNTASPVVARIAQLWYVVN